MKSYGRQGARGFTLLEVLVAMTIVGLGVVTLLEVFSSGLRLGSRSTARTEVITDGRRVMDELLSRGKLEDGAEQATAGDSVRWKLQVERVKEPAGELLLTNPWELRAVTVEVAVDEAGRERQIEFNTLRLVRKSSP